MKESSIETKNDSLGEIQTLEQSDMEVTSLGETDVDTQVQCNKAH